MFRSLLIILFSILLTVVNVRPSFSDVVYFLNGHKSTVGKETKIISVAPSVTEILYSIGLGDNIAGVTRYDDYPEDVKNKEVVGGYLDIDVEKILKIKPDVVICEPNSGIREAVELLSMKGISVIVVDVKSVMDILFAIEELGTVFDRQKEAAELLNNLTSRYVNLQKYIKKYGVNSGLVVLNENPMMVAGRNSFVGELLLLIGLKNAYSGEQKYPVLDSEMLYLMKPDIVFNISEEVMSGEPKKSSNSSERFRIFNKKSVSFHNITNPALIRPSPRFVDALEILCSLSTGYYCY